MRITELSLKLFNFCLYFSLGTSKRNRDKTIQFKIRNNRILECENNCQPWNRNFKKFNPEINLKKHQIDKYWIRSVI